MKKILCLLLAALMLLSLCACGGEGSSAAGDDEQAQLDKYSDRPKTVTLCYYEGGYGIDWLRAVAADYMENVNTEVYISISSQSVSSSSTSFLSNISTSI